MATSAIESIDSRTAEAPRKRGRISKTLRGAAAVIALGAAGTAATSTATDSSARAPRIEATAKPRPERQPQQQAEDQQVAISPGGGSLPPESLSAIPGDQIQKIIAYIQSVQAVEVGNYIAAVQAQEAADREAAAAQAAAQQARQNAQVYSNSYPGDFLACVRERESGGNYSIYNAGGSGAAGAYQFMPGTWNSIAASSGRGDLVGVDPAQASPADQDAMAQALYAQQGAAPWSGGNYAC